MGRPAGSLGKKAVIAALGGVLLVHSISVIAPASWQTAVVADTAAAAESSANTLKLKEQSYITAGAKRLDYVWSATRGSSRVQTDVHVIELDLTNPYVSLNVMSGKNNSIGQRDSILNMAKSNGAVAAINADVFVMDKEGAPMGAQVSGGVIMSSPASLKGMYAFSVTKDRKPSIDLYTFEGMVTAADGSTFPIQGLNESAYDPETYDAQFSHVNKMYIYSSVWGGAERPTSSYTKPTEVLVRGGVIEAISINEALPGAVPADGYILRTHGTAATFVKEHLKVGEPVVADYSLISQTTKAKVDPAGLEFLVGGHTLLVNNGEASAFSRDIKGVSGWSYTSRSGIGYSKDGTKVYLVTSEKYGSNTGLTLKELQEIMVLLGIEKGVNLDGGGSTTMVERPLGTTFLQLSHSTQAGTAQRSVANGIGVYTSAPQGSLKGILVSGSKLLFLGQPASYSLRGYDTYYNPIAVDHAAAVWSSKKAIGSFAGNVFTPTKTGQTTLNVKAGAISAVYEVEVVGKDQVAALTIHAKAGSLTAGATTSLPLSIKLKNGKTYKLSGDSVKWEFIGFTASQTGDSVTVESIDEGVSTGYAIARYDGFAAMIPFTQGETVKTFEDFEKSAYAITSQTAPDETVGRVKLVTDIPGQPSPRALQIDYDFTNAAGTKASYAKFGSDGIGLSGAPVSMTVDLFSDNSGNWVRAELIDADGKVHLLDLAKKLDWSGWKNVKVNLASAGMKFPAKLKRVYVVSIEEGQGERALSGYAAIDNMLLQYASSAAITTNAKVEMHISKTAATVNGKPMKLDAAPILLNGVTYVPLRFVSDAMGGRLLYDGKLSRVTLLRGDTMLEMTIGEQAINLNGVLKSSDVAPLIRNNRTLVPIRMVSENLGFKVGYEVETKKITID